MVTSDTAPVQAFISKGRIVLYRPDEKFRFVVFENGAWSPAPGVYFGTRGADDPGGAMALDAQLEVFVNVVPE